MKKIKYIICDLDGTLLNDQKRISEAQAAYIRQLREKTGIRFGFASGRAISSLKPIAKENGLYEACDLYVANNGADIHDGATGEMTEMDMVSLDEMKYPVSYTHLIGKEYGVPYEVQLEFTKNAIAKFRNRDIYDTIYRNARQAERKLGLKERMLTPLRLAAADGDETREIALVAAAALYYGEIREELDCEAVLGTMDTDQVLKGETALVRELLEGLRRKENVSTLLKK